MWLSEILSLLVRVLLGARPVWSGGNPASSLRIYYANHTSHMDALVLWSALPPPVRRTTRPVAAKDYWSRAGVRAYLARNVFNALFIERDAKGRLDDPLQPLIQALTRGESLILFPEGTRRPEALPGPFKSGLFYLAQQFPNVELVPVYLDNLFRSMPKGTHLPIPLTCTVRFGTPLARHENEDKSVFLERARQAIVEMA